MGNRGNETADSTIKLPKNIRQIGEGGQGDRVYLEDYAVTYLRQVKAAVLLGEIRQGEGRNCCFVSGALEARPGFPEEDWERLYREAKEYFDGREVVGWFECTRGGSWRLGQETLDIYRRRFEGENPVLVLYDEDEEEEAVFLAEEGTLTKQRGYYIYYEKNQPMQDYMVQKNIGKSVEKEAQAGDGDGAIRSFRKIIEEKTKGEKEKQKEKAAYGKWVYRAGAFLVLTILVIGVTMIQNYDKMKEVERTVENIAQGGIESRQPSIQASAEVKNETEEATEPAGEVSAAADGALRLDSTITGAGYAAEKASAGEDGETGTSGGQTGDEAASGGQSESVTETSASEALSHSMQAEYVIKEGDTLADVCEMYYGSLDMIDRICQVNNIQDPNQILPGQKIVLP